MAQSQRVRGQRVEAVEASGMRRQSRALGLEHRPDRLVAQLGMTVCSGISDALVQQPGGQLVVALDPQARRKEPFPHDADLVLDLTVDPLRGSTPTHRRCAGDGLDQVMAAHLQGPAIIGPLATNKDRVHRCLRLSKSRACRRP
jgi:hypothetical protein